ncbi:hypothetical protein DL96DRAFT_1556125 [Flagelloscypha sp. PMI_526]|nr:hypothetical protein DL96DRAFT_1556125 [Flagelloscypha sp. PMI_526]
MTTQNLSQSGPQALQALLNSVAPHEAPGDRLPPASLRALADKLNDLVPDDGSQMLNDEGLPIIEVSEPPLSATVQATGNALISDEHPLVPLSSLTPEQRAARRIEQNRILDILEEEERQERAQEHAKFLETHAQEIEQRKIASQAEASRLKAKKEMQKKMGKALMQQMAGAREQKEREEKEKQELDLAADQARRDASTKKGPRKKVSFANLPPESPATPVDAPLFRLSTSQTLPMKDHVVERVKAPHTPPPAKAHFHGDGKPDSDDESEPPSSEEESTTEELADEDFDIDQAAHNREIAAAYYSQKDKIGLDTQATLDSRQPAEREDLPDPSLRPPAKPTISRFKAEKLASAYNTSGPSDSSRQTLQKAIRIGKLDEGDRLVGIDGDSASEDEDPAVQEVLELLRNGQVENIGPGSMPSMSYSSKLPEVPPLPEKTKPKTSQFKLNRLQQTPSIQDPTSSTSSTPISSAVRSSPKISSFALPTVPISPSLHGEAVAPSVAPGQDPFSMIVDSPSFPAGVPQPLRSVAPSTVMSTSVVERKPAGSSVNGTSPQGVGQTKVSRFKSSRGA